MRAEKGVGVVVVPCAALLIVAATSHGAETGSPVEIRDGVLRDDNCRIPTDASVESNGALI